VVDLGSRRVDGIEAVRRVTAARLPVIAVARHDDQLTRRRALEAGAMRVFSYDKFFRDGPALVTAWLTGR
jgi:DNA-binding response OmpR family regulator